MLTPRRRAMLSAIVSNKNYLSLECIMKQYSVSRRTVYYDVAKINEWLLENYAVQIQYAKVAGYFLEEKDKKILLQSEKLIHNSSFVKYSFHERKNRIFLKLFFSQKSVTIDDIKKMNNVSKNTVLKDLRDLDKSDGISVIGSRSGQNFPFGFEAKIRKYFFKIIQSFASLQNYNLQSIFNYLNYFIEKNRKFEAEVLENLEILDKAREDYGLFYTGEIKYLFSIFAAAIHFRIRHHKFIHFDDDRLRGISRDSETKIAKKILHTMLDDEIRFFETFLISGQLNGIPTDQASLIQQDKLYCISQQIVINFERLAGVFINNRKEFIYEIYSHIRGTYFRTIYDIPNSNPILTQIKENYGEIYSITKLSVKPLEDYSNRNLSEDEIGFISIYFGGRVKDILEKKNDLTVALVCASGVGTANLLSLQLRNEIPEIKLLGPYSQEEFFQVQNSLKNINLVVSTIDLKKVPQFNYLQVTTFLSKEQITKIKNILGIDLSGYKMRHYIDGLLDIIERYAEVKDEKNLRESLREYISYRNSTSIGGRPLLSDLLTEANIHIIDDVDSWETAIKIASEPLLKAGNIEPRYVEKMIEDIEEFGPYIVVTAGVAIPHSRPEDSVKQVGMSLLKVNNGVMFGEKGSVTLIIVLATVDNTTHLKALAELTEILSEEEKLTQLFTFEKKEQYLKFIEAEEKNHD